MLTHPCVHCQFCALKKYNKGSVFREEIQQSGCLSKLRSFQCKPPSFVLLIVQSTAAQQEKCLWSELHRQLCFPCPQGHHLQEHEKTWPMYYYQCNVFCFKIDLTKCGPSYTKTKCWRVCHHKSRLDSLFPHLLNPSINKTHLTLCNLMTSCSLYL